MARVSAMMPGTKAGRSGVSTTRVKHVDGGRTGDGAVSVRIAAFEDVGCVLLDQVACLPRMRGYAIHDWTPFATLCGSSVVGGR